MGLNGVGIDGQAGLCMGWCMGCVILLGLGEGGGLVMIGALDLLIGESWFLFTV